MSDQNTSEQSIITYLGKVAAVPKGAWSAASTYEIIDIVKDNGSSYIAIQNVPTGTPLTNTTYWMLLAQKGDDSKSIQSITKTSSTNDVDTYTITLTDGSTNTFTVENGLKSAYAVDTALRVLLQRFIQTENSRHEDEDNIYNLLQSTAVETHTVTLTNSKTYPFNSTVDNPVSVALVTTRNNTNYFVYSEIINYTGGLPGIVHITDKQNNGFKISFDGSAKSVTINLKIIGGIIL